MYLSDEGSSDGFVGEGCSANTSQPCGRLTRWIVAEVAAGWWRLGVRWWVGYWQQHTELTSSGSIPTRAPLPSLNILLLLTATSCSSSLQDPTPPHCSTLLLLTAASCSSSLQHPAPPHCNILLLLTARPYSSSLQHPAPPHCKTLLLLTATSYCNLQPPMHMCSHISSNMCSVSLKNIQGKKVTFNLSATQQIFQKLFF